MQNGRMVKLHAEGFSPWCEKARWALDHHQVPYRATEHVPMIGELRLRLAARRARGRVTIPLLVDGPEVLMDSVAIARFAERRGLPAERGSAPLFPGDRETELERWNACSEVVMTSGRALLLRRMLGSPAALREQLPPFVPGALRSLLQPLAARGVRFVMRKYQLELDEEPLHVSRIRSALASVREALGGGRPWLLGGYGFSFADITVATSLQFILPVSDRYMPLGPATREVWTHPALAAEFADLLAWRDALYAAHRRPADADAGRAAAMA